MIKKLLISEINTSIILSFFLILCSAVTSAQQKCGVDRLIDKQAQYAPSITEPNRSHALVRNAVIHIPVVIHLIYRKEENNLSDALIYRQLDILNGVFNNKGKLRSFPLGGKNYPEATPRIHFCLADKDIAGNPTSGIIRTQTTIKNIGTTYLEQNRRAAFYDHTGGQDAWNPKKYLNIWICEAEDILGSATIPTEPHFPQESGVLISVDYVADQSQNGRGYTLVHEMGHFFGLYHLWGREEGCNSDDGVEDTPQQEKPVYICADNTSCSSADMIFNFMGYTDDYCMEMFTRGQAERMRSIIKEYYPTLIESETACTSSVDETDDFIIKLQSQSLFLLSKNRDLLSGNLKLYGIDGELLLELTLNKDLTGAIKTMNIPSGIYIIHYLPENNNPPFQKKIFIP